jgi:hypothetical protein
MVGMLSPGSVPSGGDIAGFAGPGCLGLIGFFPLEVKGLPALQYKSSFSVLNLHSPGYDDEYLLVPGSGKQFTRGVARAQHPIDKITGMGSQIIQP